MLLDCGKAKWRPHSWMGRYKPGGQPAVDLPERPGSDMTLHKAAPTQPMKLPRLDSHPWLVQTADMTQS
jgi:hypothetical protein